MMLTLPAVGNKILGLLGSCVWTVDKVRIDAESYSGPIIELTNPFVGVLVMSAEEFSQMLALRVLSTEVTP